MTHPPVQAPPAALPVDLLPVFEPLHKRALGMALGVATGLTAFLITAIYLLRAPIEGMRLELLAEYFYGYTVTWPGAFVALAWGFVVGFVAGWFAAFMRNFVMAVSIFIGRARGEMEQNRDFLDHI